MNKVFLDHGASTPVCKEVLTKLNEMATDFYNSNSIYEKGLENRKEIEEVRKKVAKMINAEPNEIYFTCSASESNTLCIDGFLKRHSDYDVICSALEHSSIYNNPNIDYVIPCDENGFIDIEYIKGFKRKSLFAIMHSSNELGIINPIKSISDIIHRRCGYLLCDASSSFGKVKIDVKELDVDFLTASGYKIGSLNGVGICYIREGIDIASLIIGNQEKGIRGGTQNSLAIKSLGIAIDNLKLFDKVSEVKNYLAEQLEAIDDVIINSSKDGLPNLVNFTMKNISLESDQLVSLLDEFGFMVSSSSACNGYKRTPSHVLKAIGLSDFEANRTIRVTLGHENTFKEMDSFVECIKLILNMDIK